MKCASCSKEEKNLLLDFNWPFSAEDSKTNKTIRENLVRDYSFFFNLGEIYD